MTQRRLAIVELPEDLYQYIGIVSPERAFKLSTNNPDAREFRTRIEELFNIIRNTDRETQT